MNMVKADNVHKANLAKPLVPAITGCSCVDTAEADGGPHLAGRLHAVFRMLAIAAVHIVEIVIGVPLIIVGILVTTSIMAGGAERTLLWNL